MKLQEVFNKLKTISKLALDQNAKAKKIAFSKTAKLKELKRETLALVRVVEVLNQSLIALLTDSFAVTKALLEKNEELKESLNREEKLKDVLRFYSNKENWQLLDGKKSVISLDEGQRAKLALSNDDNSANE